MLHRTFDAGKINALVNHPAIRPAIGGDGASVLDLTEAVADRDNVFLLGEHGGFSLIWTAPDCYEIHTFITPEGRGRAAYQLARAGRDWMADYGAKHLWTRIPKDMTAVQRFTLAAGFSCRCSKSWDFGHGPVEYLIYDWRA
jgi:hypothetical protein